MDAETIKREAREALLDLKLDSNVSNITQSGHNWCVQFEGDYGQFCDSFQNQFEHDNSPRVVREKIKKHLLGQITQMRNKGGRRTTKKGFDEQDSRNVTELFQEAVSETTRAIGEAIDRTLGVTGATIKAAGDVAETVSARTAEMIRPEEPASEPSRPQAAPRTPARESATVKGAGKAKRSGTKRKAAGKTKRAATKKATAKKKSSRKR
jgi:hypothetical protein